MANQDQQHTDRADRTTSSNAPQGALLHLSDMKDAHIPDGEPDIRGWNVKTADGKKLGTVTDLLIDTAQGRVRYLEIDVDHDVAKETGRDYALIPVGAARLNDDDDTVIVSMQYADLPGLPAYDRKNLTREYEQSLRNFYDRATIPSDRSQKADHATSHDTDRHNADRDRGSDFYTHPSFDDRRFFGNRRQGREEVSYLVIERGD